MDKKKAKEFGGSEPFNRMKKDIMKEVCGLLFAPPLPSFSLCWPLDS